jgi:cytochrome c oxidase cbb3-type subunit III
MTKLERARTLAALAVTLAAASAITACEREDRKLNERQPDPPTKFVSQVRLQPGPMLLADTVEGPYDDNAYEASEGQILFEQMNCSGCHANGGGGMGPALMDDEWIYGSLPNQIFATIAEGRPNGMPSWKYKLNDRQIWQLVSYVRALSGLTPKGARTNREDHMMVKPSASQTPNAKAKNTGLPGASQRP